MTEPLILSSSAMGTWLTCHKQYLYGYVYRITGQPNVAMALGTAVHAAAEAYWKSPLRPMAVFTETFAQEVPDEPDEDIALAAKDGERMVDVYITKVAPTFSPTLVEAEFLITINNIGYSGVIDAADEDLHDLKTTAGKTINGRKPKFDPSSYDVQVTGYSFGYEWLTGKKPRKLYLDVLTRRGTYRRYERQPDVSQFIDTLGLVSSGIMKGDFEPTGALNGSCSWCPYRNICTDAKVD